MAQITWYLKRACPHFNSWAQRFNGTTYVPMSDRYYAEPSGRWTNGYATALGWSADVYQDRRSAETGATRPTINAAIPGWPITNEVKPRR